MKILSFLVVFLLSGLASAGEGDFCVPFLTLLSNQSNNVRNLLRQESQDEFGTVVQQNDNSSLEVYNYYQKIKNEPAIQKLLPEALVNSIFLDVSNPALIDNLSTLISAIKDRKQTTERAVVGALKELLAYRVPENQTDSRVKALINKREYDLEKFKYALGALSLSDAQNLLYGTNPLKPSRESLIGEYIRQTGAQTLTRSFDYGPRRRSQLGPKRLVVAVSRSSFKVFAELMNEVNYLFHLHTPEQGTLMLEHEGKVGTYADLSNDFRMPQIGTIMPTIVLSTSEGARAKNFFKLASEDGDVAQEPWQLENEKGKKYCARGGYESCTHWFGNIPVGDALVKEYTFPGKVDEHAYNDVGRGPQKQTLVAHAHENPLASVVWTAPGHQQLGEVLGLSRQQNAGELANPGYVAISLTARAPVERVPVVFVFVNDHRQKIDPDFDTKIAPY